jgi:hypothetical protein
MKGFEPLSNDLLSVGAGFIGAFLKGVKHKLGAKITIISAIAGGFLCYATVGVIETFFTNVPAKITITIAFFVGFVANTITDHADDFINELYQIAIKKAGGKKKDSDEAN